MAEDKITDRSRRKSGGLYCSVVNCHRNTKAHNDKVRFFKFPSNNPEKRQLWIQALKRVNPDGTPWQPTESSRVCSDHFISGNHSPTRTDPDYKPTKFPTAHIREKSNSDIERFERARARSLSQTVRALTLEQPAEDLACHDDDDSHRQKHVSTQASEGSKNPCSSFTVTYESVDSEVTVKNGHFLCNKGTQYSTKTSSEIAVATNSVVTQEFSHGVQKNLGFGSFNLETMTERKFTAFTGIQKNLFRYILDLAEDEIFDSKNIRRDEKLALFLAAIKLNASYAALGGMFEIGEHAASNHFEQMLGVMVKIAKTGVIWYSKDKVKARLPPSFKALYPDCRVIIDCSEIQCEIPGTLKERTLLYSHYKSRHTLKFLIGCAPSGEIMFISQTFGGRTTDTEATIKSGFVDLLESNDAVLADKGFPNIENDVNTKGGLLVMPPFKQKNRQFSTSENRQAYECAAVRVHVERCIARMKIFECLHFVRREQFRHIDDVLYVISYLCNMGNDLIKQD